MVSMAKNLYDELGKASIKHNRAISKLIEKLTLFCGIDRFWRNVHHKDGSYSVLGNVPSIAESFFGQNLFLGHPYFRDPLFFQSGFTLPDFFSRHDYEKTQGQLQKKGDCFHVLIYIKKQDDGFIEYGFAKSQFTPGFETVYLNNLPAILKFIDYFEASASQIAREADETKVDIAHIIGASYYENPKLPGGLIVPEKELAFVAAIEEKSALLELTKSEKAVLRHYLNGNSTSEIAKKCFRSPRTIETHLESAKSKLGVRSRSALFDLLLPFRDYL